MPPFRAPGMFTPSMPTPPWTLFPRLFEFPEFAPRFALPCESANRITSGTAPPAGTRPFAVTTALAACSALANRISAPAVVVPDACSSRHSMIAPNTLKNALSSTSVHRGGKPLT